MRVSLILLPTCLLISGFLTCKSTFARTTVYPPWITQYGPTIQNYSSDKYPQAPENAVNPWPRSRKYATAVSKRIQNVDKVYVFGGIRSINGGGMFAYSLELSSNY